MRAFIILSLALLGAIILAPAASWGASISQNQLHICRVRIQALNAAGKLLPGCRRGDTEACERERKDVYDVLELKSKCKISTMAARIGPLGAEQASPFPGPAITFYVSPTGSDSNDGTSELAPFLTLEMAVAAATARSQSEVKYITVLPGEHRIEKTLQIGQSGHRLAIIGKNDASGVRPKITTKVLLPRATNPCSNYGKKGIVQCEIHPSIMDKIGELSQLFVNGEPAIRARTPNVKSHFIEAWDKRNARKWTSSKPLALKSQVDRVIVPNDHPDVTYQPNAPQYDSYTMACVDELVQSSPFQPPCGYFLHPQHVAQGGCVWTVPRSASWQKNVFSKVWAKPQTGLFHVLHWYGWGAWTFRPESQTKKKVAFGNGGWQEARGDCKKGGKFWYVENVFELLDSSNEYFIDYDAGMLYYIPPSATSNPVHDPSVRLELTAQVRDMIHIAGANRDELVSNIVIRNLEFSGAYETTMDKFEVPSGGDWSYHRSGAIHIEQARNVIVEDCGFHWLGGNGVVIGRRAEDIRVLRNDFYALGASAILVLGDPGFETDDPWVMKDFPLNVHIEGNLASRIGRQVKQTSAVMISLARSTVVTGNVFYLGPRAGITMNDQWGGGNVISRNVVFEFVKATGDHGPFILWHRQMFEDTVIKEYDVLEENLFIGTPGVGKDGGGKGINLDDGAHKVIVRNNVVAAGFQKMKGSNLIVHGNLIVQPLVTSCVFFSHFNRLPARQEFINNTCITSKHPIYGLGVGGNGLNGVCQSRDNYLAEGNVFYTPKGNKLRGCMKNWSTWRKKWGQDKGSITFKSMPSQAKIDEWILDRLHWIPRP